MSETVFPGERPTPVPQNFKRCDRSQRFLLPVDMRDWLPGDHLVHFVLDTVQTLDLSRFYASYRADGWGRAAFDPRVMVALILYAFCVGERSTRGIERRCIEDVAFRIITAGDAPDHSTIARFISRHHPALEELFGQVVGVCVTAGLVRSETVAVDGTKIAANASSDNNLTAEQIADYARRVFEEAARINTEEDRRYGERRGDELPPFLTDRTTRVEWIKEQLQQQQNKRDARTAKGYRADPRRGRIRVNTTDPDSRTMKVPKGFVQGYNAQAVVTEDHIAVAGRVTNENADSGLFHPMVRQAKTILDTAGGTPIHTVVADAGYFSADNLTAPIGAEVLIAPLPIHKLREAIARAPAMDSGNGQLRGRARDEEWVRVRQEDERRIEVLNEVLEGNMKVTAAARALAISQPHASNLKNVLRQQGPDAIRRKNLPPGARHRSPTEIALARLSRPGALLTYAKRAIMAEPLFGEIKEPRGMRKFLRRGTQGCNTEWLLILTTNNLRKAWRRTRPRTHNFQRRFRALVLLPSRVL
jgi:transposase